MNRNTVRAIHQQAPLYTQLLQQLEQLSITRPFISTPVTTVATRAKRPSVGRRKVISPLQPLLLAYRQITQRLRLRSLVTRASRRNMLTSTTLQKSRFR
jgi:hypothetical protein